MFKFIKEFRELRRLAYYDSLTGLLNRNWLYKNIGNIKAKYIYFIDINNLHEINKQGHIFGDKYIKDSIATINHNGILVRYGGDEFILFSDYENEVIANQIFTVGCSVFISSIENSIKIADLNMIRNKNLNRVK
jgi:GGDEF domain-containing protein